MNNIVGGVTISKEVTAHGHVGAGASASAGAGAGAASGAATGGNINIYKEKAVY